MSFKDFKIVETIGKGSFASVFKVVRRSDNKVYALKRVKINKMSKKEIGDALNEIRFLASIRHKNIVGFLEAFLENNETELCIVMEYCGSGDLAQKVERYKRKRQYVDERVIWRYLIQALKALEHLHGKGICHRDLKVANTFLAEDGSIKIGDMNVSKRLEKGHLKTQIGTPYYMSPEIWNNKPYDFRSDIWSLGCMIYELSALRPPFLGDSFPALKRAVTIGRYSPLPSKFSDALSRVIGLMLKLDHRSRPSAEALLKNPDVVAKMQLDETSTSFSQHQAANAPVLSLINTIKVPQHLRKLTNALPKPCYPDVRPNSPTSWTVAEQKVNHVEQLKLAQRKAQPPPLPPVANLPSMEKENLAPPSSARSNASGGDGESVKSSRSSKVKGVPAPPPGGPQSSLAAAVEYYNRRPMAPLAPNSQRPSGNNGGGASTHEKGYKVPGLGGAAAPYPHPNRYQPTLDPIPAAAAKAAVAHQQAHQPAAPAGGAPPSSVAYDRHGHYQHHSRAQRARYNHYNNNHRIW